MVFSVGFNGGTLWDGECSHYRRNESLCVANTNTFSVMTLSLDTFLEVIKKSNETPVKKFQFPQTSSQEIGWNTKPLVSWQSRIIIED